jgi:hypothetical protein
MKRFLATTSGWRAGVIAGALLAIVGLAGPAAAQNTNLTATARYSASSSWDSERGDTTFIAAKAFDGNLATRWNVDRAANGGEAEGSWLAAEWDTPQTISRVVVHEAFDRFDAIRIQRRDVGGAEWQDVKLLEGEEFQLAKTLNPTTLYPIFSYRFPQPIQAGAFRVVFEQTTSSPSILEVEAWNNPSGTITGTVTDPGGQPVAGAVVRAGLDYTVTNAEGKYTMLADAGSYNLQAGKFGSFRIRSARGVDVTAGGTVTQDFSLLPEPTNLSLSATAVSSSDFDENFDAAKAKDSNLVTRWNALGEPEGATLEMQWDQAQTFNRIIFRQAFDRIRTYTLQGYDAASDTYVNILSGSIPDRSSGGDRNAIHPVVTHVLPTPVTSTRLRLVVDTTLGGDPSIRELEVANAPVGTVRGVVKDIVSGNAIANATIVSDDGTILGTTNDKGEFSLVVEPNEYFASASAEGYFTGLPVTFTVNAGETREITLMLPARGPNIALTGTASASSEDVGAEAALVNDGDLTTFWRGFDTTNQWVAVTWEQPTKFTAVQLRGFQGNVQASSVQVLDTDGTTWKDLPGASFTPQFLGTRPADFLYPDGVTTKGVRFFSTGTDSLDVAPGLAELMVFDAPLPQPAP